jgi:uncharacterized membrane protein
MGWGHHGFFPFSWIFIVLFAIFLFRFFGVRRYGRRWHGWHDGRVDAEAILQLRLAKGEINEEEYRRLKEILSK